MDIASLAGIILGAVMFVLGVFSNGGFEALKNIDADEVKIGLNHPLSATMFRPNSEEDFVGLIMPVQIR